MRNQNPSGPPAVTAIILLAVISYFGSYLALASRHERPDGSFHVVYATHFSWCYYFYHPAHVIDAKVRYPLWQGEFGLTLFPRTQYFGREHHLGGDKFQDIPLLLERQYARK